MNNDRDEQINAHVTWNVKEALRKEAFKRTMSVSALIFTLLKDQLQELGYDLDGEKLTA